MKGKEMIAHSLDSDRLFLEIKKVMRSMKKVESTCEYYSLVGDNVVLYYPSKLNPQDKSGLYLINGIIY